MERIFKQLQNNIKQTPNINIKLTSQVENIKGLTNTVDSLYSLLTGDGLNQLARKGLQVVLQRTLSRLSRTKIGPLELGSGKKYSRNRARSLVNDVKALMDSVYVIGGGKVGFGKVASLNTIVMSNKTKSPYNIAWQIMEFGSGRYAHRTRTTGRHKVPDGTGDWFFGRMVIRGQTGADFLFGLRQNRMEVAKDADEALKAVSEEIQKALSGAASRVFSTTTE